MSVAPEIMEPMSDPDVPDLDPGAVLWSAPPDERAGRPLLVLLHGYGADEHDLFGLVPYLPEGFVVASVRAPLTPPWPAPGAAWYRIEDVSGRESSAVTDAAASFLAWLDAVGHDGPVGLLGFSQGGAVALQSLRLRPEGFALIVMLAGYAALGDLPRDPELAELKPPVFWGRGARDDVIPASLVAHTTEWLPAHAELSGRVYAGLTHSVSQAELDDVTTFLAKRLAALTRP
jgi:phospholipase/carboxylesterase